MVFKRISAVLCLALALSAVCNAAPRSYITDSIEDWVQRPYRLQEDSVMPQFHPQDDNQDDGIHVNTHGLEIKVLSPHSFMEVYGWIPHMDEDFRDFSILSDGDCVEFSIKIVGFKACLFKRGVTMDISAFGMTARAIECADVTKGCSVNPIDSFAGKVGVNGICQNGTVHLKLNLRVGPEIFRGNIYVPYQSIGLPC